MRFDILMVGRTFRDSHGDLWIKVITRHDTNGQYNAERYKDNARGYFYANELVEYVG